VILTSPENALDTQKLKPFLTQQVTGRRLKIIVDEAHLVKRWGESGFRKPYLELGLLRTFVPQNVPFSAFSATMTESTREAVRKTLQLDPRELVLINLGNHRSNIIWDVKHISGTESAIHEICDFLPQLDKETVDIPLTLVFVNDRMEGQAVFSLIQDWVPEHLVSQVYYLHSLRTQRYKSRALQDCHSAGAGIYICTEIAATVSAIL
jgi:superfamily II DNA helicase RecQ